MSTLHELKYFAWPPLPSVFFGMAPRFKAVFLGVTPPNPTSPPPPHLVKNERSLSNFVPRVLSNWMTTKCSNCVVCVKKVPCFSFFSRPLHPRIVWFLLMNEKKGGKFDLFTDNVVHVVLETTNHSPLYHRTLCISLGHRAGDTRQQPSVSRHETNALEYHSKDSGRK